MVVQYIEPGVCEKVWVSFPKIAQKFVPIHGREQNRLQLRPSPQEHGDGLDVGD